MNSKDDEPGEDETDDQIDLAKGPVRPRDQDPHLTSKPQLFNCYNEKFFMNFLEEVEESEKGQKQEIMKMALRGRAFGADLGNGRYAEKQERANSKIH
ncbi:16394_t:CDS:2 [Acaulospora colombiana]|uniref:16394_t:CDS:1 n=1 Tax=Acaulospora colombiana TaxID=27376 RepID=A0ACA9KDS8_9GLOM|nr:16394_t:CDS:2 [Acaulospora colombiana]